jgi:hypothetical protein
MGSDEVNVDLRLIVLSAVPYAASVVGCVFIVSSYVLFPRVSHST